MQRFVDHCEDFVFDFYYFGVLRRDVQLPELRFSLTAVVAVLPMGWGSGGKVRKETERPVE